jgi:hypothetical protein
MHLSIWEGGGGGGGHLVSKWFVGESSLVYCLIPYLVNTSLWHLPCIKLQ